MLWSQPLPIRLRMYSRHDFSHFGLVPGRTPDMAGRWPGLSGRIGELPASFNWKLKFLRCPVDFHNRPHIVHIV